MKELAATIRRFPARELTIRRLCAQVPDFRTLCEDYSTATSALERWSADKGKAEDYRQICAELEEEIQEHLEKSLRWSRQ